MKMILVPSDFTETAENAAVYALHLAKTMQAGVKLFNVFKAPVEVVGTGVDWPLSDYTSIEKEITTELYYLATRLKGSNYAAAHTYAPIIECECETGPETTTITAKVAQERISLVVMGMSEEGSSEFFLGSTNRDIIDKTNCPLLLIPNNMVYKNPEKIAFATDLRASDVDIVHALASFARYYNAEILLIHVTDGTNEGDYHEEVKEFLKGVSSKINYEKVYYRHVKSIDVKHGLDWLAEHGQVDMLAMVHRKHNILDRLFAPSHTHEVAGDARIPVLVFPEAGENVVVSLF